VNELLMGDVIRTAAARTPQHPAASLGDRVVTFAEVNEQSHHLAMVLAGRGVRRGARVSWWGETTLDVLPLYFALAHLGAVFAPMNPRYNDEEAKQVLDRAEPALVVTDDQHPGDVTIGELLAARRPSVVEIEDPHEDDPFIIFFTSGTTGSPKGCVLTQRTQRLRGGNGSWPTGASVCMFPQFHMAGWGFTGQAWLSGDEVAFVERADAEHILSAVHRRRAATLYCIPAVWRRILETDRSPFDLTSLRQVNTGTSATTPDLLAAIADAFPGTTTSIAYGSTEASAVCTLWPQDVLRKPNSVGPPAAGVYVRLDEHGELWARNSQLFSGYFRDPEATAAALVDGWYRTGEIAEVDEEGYYYITGRAKDTIRTGGETVAPVEVDLVLQSHPAIADGAVAGIPDPDWGEVIAAFVVLREGHQLSIEDMRSYCQDRLAPHKHPRRLVVVEQIPRTPTTGQVQRRRLVELAMSVH